MVEIWEDGLGTVWELVSLDLGAIDGPCLVRQGYTAADRLDGDMREGVEVIGRFVAAEDARCFLAEEGFAPR